MNSSTVLFRGQIKEEFMIQDQIQSLAQTTDPIILEKLPPLYVYYLHHVFQQVFQVHQIKMLPMDEDLEKRLDLFIEKLPPEKLNRAFNAYLEHLEKYKPNKYQLWFNLFDVLESSLRTPVQPNPDPAPASEIEKPKKQPTPINPDLKNLPSFALVKHYALVRKTTVFDFILEQSRSPSFARVHGFIQHKNNYKLSSKGKVVYDGGFYWIARELEISIWTVWRAFHWMASFKLVTKIGPQNLEKHKRSRWYVCTSMAQNLKLWSLAYQGKKA